MKYKQYIENGSWKDKSDKYLQSNSICEICHKHTATQVHHNSYARIGEELEEDLTAICDRCHYGIHSMVPYIEDTVQLKKAINLMERFTKSPAIKTATMNKISDNYFKGMQMIEVGSEYAPETPFFLQNIMEVWYEKGLEIGSNIIEEALQYAIYLRISAKKNIMESAKKQEKIQAKIAEDGYYHKPAETIQTTIRSLEEKLNDQKRVSILIDLDSVPKLLSKAKSFMNVNFYSSKVFFNAIGCGKSHDFYQKIAADGYANELYDYIEEFKRELGVE